MICRLASSLQKYEMKYLEYPRVSDPLKGNIPADNAIDFSSLEAEGEFWPKEPEVSHIYDKSVMLFQSIYNHAHYREDRLEFGTEHGNPWGCYQDIIESWGGVE
jgi:hypothetical protein